MKRATALAAAATTLSLFALFVTSGCGTTETNNSGGTPSSSGSAQGGGSASGGGTAQGGGSASGGSSAQGGGSASGGGSAQGGGSASGGGSAQGGGGAGNGGTPECMSDLDCDLINNCCDCEGVPNGTTLPCGMNECLVSTCFQYESPAVTASCQVGQCVTSVNCDHSQVLCDAPPPTCQPGLTPSVKNGCWGACIAPTQCTTVGSCAQCGPYDACITQITQTGPQIHCVAPPAACNGGTPNCACMGGSVCVAPYDTCSDSAAGISCSCINC